jgi:arylsulfatase A-like enzyme
MNGPKSTSSQASRWQGVPLALGLGLALLILSYSRIAGDTQTALFHDSVLDSVLAGQLLRSQLLRNVAGFGCALLLLHCAYGLLCLGLARLSAVAWPSARTPLNQRIFLCFLVITAWLLASNAQHFPRSSLGNPYAQAMHSSLAGHAPAWWLGCAITLLTGLMTVLAARKSWQQGSARSRMRSGAITAVVLAGVAIAFVIPESKARPPETARGKPNVVLIGIDSLREDIVAPATTAHVMPNLEAFLARSTSFSNATTPLARTFPSWVSILSGRSPHVTGAVVNLLPRDIVHEGDTLGTMFRKAGYTTAYAIDDVRFSNIDTSYGFDEVVTPPIGASEFVIGFFADTPLSNLVLNTPIGRLLFPYVYGNRAAATTYDPDTFVHRIASEIDFRQPLFLAVHLTLPHWPYWWADAPPSHSVMGTPGERWPDYYLYAARRADQQFGAVLDVLRRRGVLDDALVFVLSDHGETFGAESDSLVPEDTSSIVALHAVPGWGHGTSVLTPEQYHVVLGVRGFGSAPLRAGAGSAIDVPVSVEDIAPTVTDLLGLNHRGAFDGRSLVPLLREAPGAQQAMSGRIRFTETEFNPAAVATQTGKISASALAQAAVIYRIDPVTDRLEIKRGFVPRLLRERQYAALGKEFLIAAIPPNDEADTRGFQYFVVDQRGGKPQPLNGPPGPEAPAEVQALWQALQGHFGSVLERRRTAATAALGPLSGKAAARP